MKQHSMEERFSMLKQPGRWAEGVGEDPESHPAGSVKNTLLKATVKLKVSVWEDLHNTFLLWINSQSKMLEK